MFQFILSSSRKSIVSRAMSESNTRGIQSKPLLIDMNAAKDVPICINCKYFNKHPTLKESSYGKCHKFGELDVIDGTIHYKQIEIARQYFCHGNDYEEIDRKEVDSDSHKEKLF